MLSIFKKKEKSAHSSDDFLSNPVVAKKAHEKQKKSAENTKQFLDLLPWINKNGIKIALIITYVLITSIIGHIYFLIQLF